MVPLLLRGVDRACPQHGPRDATATAANAMEAHHHGNQGSTDTPAPRDSHPVSDCCPAMNNCSGGATIETATNDVAGTSWHDELPGYDATLLRSRVESPDPPPPKA